MVPASSPRPTLAAWKSHHRWLRRFVEAVLKGFAIGSGLKGSLALFSALVRLRSLLVSRRAKSSLFLAARRS
jgi:hypothetical protein